MSKHHPDSIINDPAELERWGDLGDIWHNAWAALQRGGTDRRDAFHMMALATLRTNFAGGAVMPSVRTVIVRKAIPETARLLFHVDARSAKFAELAVNPQCSLLFYDPKRQMQIRLQARATLHTTGELASERWERSIPLSRRCYCGVEVPGEESDTMTSGLEAEILRDDITMEESEAGRKNFAVVECSVLEMDWFLISIRGHRRARFRVDAEPGTLVDAVWLVP